jgi:hypothetical protein
MNRRAISLLLAGAAALGLLGAAAPVCARSGPAASIPSAALIAPAQLAARLNDATLPAPLILQVGFRMLFDQAHIRGAEFAGPAGQDDGLALLRARVAALPRESPIVIYCGCCPWRHCPNIAAAYDALHALGFTQLKVLHLVHDFGDDWVRAGYPVTRNASPGAPHAN